MAPDLERANWSKRLSCLAREREITSSLKTGCFG